MVQGLSLPPNHLHGVWGVIQQFSIHALSTVRAEAKGTSEPMHLVLEKRSFDSAHCFLRPLPYLNAWVGQEAQ